MGIWRADNPLGLAWLMCQIASLVSELRMTNKGYLLAAHKQQQLRHRDMNTKKIVGSVASIQTLNAEERKRKSCKRFLPQKYAFNLCNVSDDKVLQQTLFQGCICCLPPLSHTQLFKS